MTDLELGAHLSDEPVEEMDGLAMDMVPVAARFAVTVHERDAETIDKAIRRMSPRQKDALLVVLGAMVPVGIGVRDLLAWVDDPDWANNKQCFRCGQVKPRTEFTTDRTKADGKRGECRHCSAAARRGAA